VILNKKASKEQPNPKGFMFNIPASRDIKKDFSYKFLEKGGELAHKKFPRMLIFRSAYKLIYPNDTYKNLICEAFGVGVDDCFGDIVGYNLFSCASDGIVYFPKVATANFNPYKFIQRNYSCVSRRFKVRNMLEKVTKNNPHLLGLVLTYPKEISEKLFNMPDANKIVNDCFSKFYLKFEKFLCKNNNEVAGFWSNLHQWKSEEPYTPHFHHHVYGFNFVYDKVLKTFRRIQPFFSEEKLKIIKGFWCEIVNNLAEKLGIDTSFSVDGQKDKKEIVIHFHYYKEQGKIIHQLRYCSRSFLIDVANFCNDKKIKSKNDFVNGLRKLKDLKAIVNRTKTFGYLKYFKRCLNVEQKKVFGSMKNKIVCPVCFKDLAYAYTLSAAELEKIGVWEIHKKGLRYLGEFG